jgi:adenylate cyclase
LVIDLDNTGGQVGLASRLAHSRRLRHVIRRWYRSLTMAAAVALAFVVGVTTGAQTPFLDGILFDLASFLTARQGGAEPVALIALDPDSLAFEKFKALPRAFFGPWLGDMTGALFASGARAVGFDLLFSYSAAAALGANYDLKLREVVARNLPRIVAVRTLRTPLAEEWTAAFYDPDLDTRAGREEPAAIAYSELVRDADGVVRRFQPNFRAGDTERPLPTFVGELLSRLGMPIGDEFLLRPDRALERIPTYRFVDVVSCAEQDPDALRRVFAEKAVIVGTNLPAEDRIRGPDRFFPPPPATPPRPAGRCSLAPLGSSDPESGTVPGMFLHAAAVRAVLRGEPVRLASRAERAPMAVFAGAAGAAAGLLVPPLWAVMAAVLGAVLIFATSAGVLATGVWLPPALPAILLVATMVGAYLIRFFVEERRRQRVQRAFTYYLAPAIVERLTEQEEALRLGGESRQISVMFADLSGFTALSGRMPPEELMELTNRYLGLMAASVESTGGYVNQFLGDAVMAIWGAPLPDTDHAANAARAALRVVDSVMQAKTKADATGAPGYAVKVGLNTGPAVVGNIGAPTRYNYTAVGETVNIAARLESVPPDYGARIVLGPMAAEKVSAEFLVCELDWLRVKGKKEAIAVFELICARNSATEANHLYVAGYGEALAAYRGGRLSEAAALWEGLHDPRRANSPDPTPAYIMAERSRTLKQAPPDWDGVWTRESK